MNYAAFARAFVEKKRWVNLWRHLFAFGIVRDITDAGAIIPSWVPNWSGSKQLPFLPDWKEYHYIPWKFDLRCSGSSVNRVPNTGILLNHTVHSCMIDRIFEVPSSTSTWQDAGNEFTKDASCLDWFWTKKWLTCVSVQFESQRPKPISNERMSTRKTEASFDSIDEIPFALQKFSIFRFQLKTVTGDHTEVCYGVCRQDDNVRSGDWLFWGVAAISSKCLESLGVDNCPFSIGLILRGTDRVRGDLSWEKLLEQSDFRLISVCLHQIPDTDWRHESLPSLSMRVV